MTNIWIVLAVVLAPYGLMLWFDLLATIGRYRYQRRLYPSTSRHAAWARARR